MPNKKHTKIYSIAALKQKHPSWYKEDILTLLSMLKAKQIKPVISKTFSLLDARDAHILLESRGIKGKIVLLPENMNT
ncbi:MAG: zinc-binding dehydrogenase [Pseudomonadota bacterium]